MENGDLRIENEEFILEFCVWKINGLCAIFFTVSIIPILQKF